MTRFTKDNIPASVQTLEQLFVWAGVTLDNMYKDVEDVEALDANGVERPSRSITANVFFNDAPKTTEHRIIVRGSLKVDDNYSLGPVWVYVNDLGSAAIPSGFT